MSFMQETRDRPRTTMQDGELLVRVRYIAEVVATKCAGYQTGDLIEGQAALEEYSILEANQVRRLGEQWLSRSSRILRFEKIILDQELLLVSYDGQEVELTRKEYLLLKLLLENPQKVFTRDELLDLVWGYECYPVTRTVDNHILHLRQKLGAHLFETVRGVGYRLTSREAIGMG